jgi:MarR family transcriptional regulator for hemolysin
MKNYSVPSDFLEALTKVSRKMRTAFDQQVTAHGLTYPRARALFLLAKKQHLTQSELALELELQQATVVRLVDRMEENGLIERRPDAKDRRVNLLFLTPYGNEQADLVRSIADRMRKHISAGIDAGEMERAVALLERISASLSDLENIDVSEL